MEYNPATKKWKINATEVAALERVRGMLAAMEATGSKDAEHATNWVDNAFHGVLRPKKKPEPKDGK